MIALKLHCVPIVPLFHHSLRGVGATLRAGGQLQSEAELISVASSACGGEIHFILYMESGLCYLILL